MKKKMFKNVIAVVLAAVVAIGSGYGTQAMAATSDAGSEIRAVTANDDAIADVIKEAIELPEAAPSADVTMKAGVYAVPVLSNAASKTILIPFAGGNGSSISLQVTSGLFYGVFSLSKATDVWLDVVLKDASGKSVASTYITAGSVSSSSALMAVLPSGTYTLTVTGRNYSGQITGQLLCGTYPSQTEMSLGFSSSTVSYNYNADGAAKYYKIICTSPGVLAIGATTAYVSKFDTTWSTSGVKINLCKSNKAPLLTSDQYTSSYEGYVKNYYVNKGTYYIRVTGYSGYIQNVMVNFKSRGSVGSNTSKGKAATIKVSKTIKRTMPLNGKADSNWYKISVKGSQKNAIVIRNYSSDTNLKCVVKRNGKTVSSLSGTIPANKEVCLYSVSYKSGVRSLGSWKSGTYTIQLSEQNKNGNAYYEISCQQLTPTPSVKSITVGKKQMTVKWAKKSIVDGYQIRYSTSSKMKSAKKVTVKKATTVKKTLKKLKKGKVYYVQIRTYKKLNGLTYYSSWSKAKKSKKIK